MVDRRPGPLDDTELPARPDDTALTETPLKEEGARTRIKEEDQMQQESLSALVDRHLEAASTASSGRSAHTVYGGHEHVLRQTLIALRGGSRLDEHQNPGEATLQVLRGRVILIAGGSRWGGSAGDLIAIPHARHSLEAVEDSAVLLTVAVRR
jgi:quercetin dioxygenase-like cupin family protein